LPQPNVAPEPGLTPPPLPQPIARATHTQSLVAASADFESLVASTRHPDEKVRQDAVLRLSRVDSPRAVDALNAVLARDPMPEVRDTAARVLGGMGKAGALVALRTAAASDPDATVRQSATYSVEMIQARLRGQ
jgi:HEAT repeat protein